VPDDRRVLEGVERLVVDGTNVLHALRRSTTPLPAAALIGRLRAIVPPGVSVIVVLDGSPEHGLASRHVASGVEIRYAGRFTADEVIARLVEYEFAASSPGILVVTDDIELTGIVRRSGGRTTRNGWLIDRLDRQRLSAPSIGRPRAQRPNKPNEPPRGSRERQPNEPPRGSRERQPNEAQPGAPSRRGSSERQPNEAQSGAPSRRGSSEQQPNEADWPPNPPGRVAGPGTGRGAGAGGGRSAAPGAGPGIGRGAGPGIGRGAGPDPAPDDATADDRPRWSPGRGATRKRGNGRRKPASGR
jgi:predicted RNA-binding protein with PIN domain